MNFLLPEPLILPLSHHHILEGLIYHILHSHTGYSSFLHETGYQIDNGHFKLFTFGPLSGRYQIENKQIIFSDSINWEIRSVDKNFCTLLQNHLSCNIDYKMGESSLMLKSFHVDTVPRCPAKVEIQMVSPIVLYHTVQMDSGRKTIYHNPLEENYSLYINNNFQRKYKAAYHKNALSEIKISALSVSTRDKYVTCYKGQTYITGWRGLYLLEGAPSDIQFLYETGLGSKNSEGFGMFRMNTSRNK